MDQSHFTPLGHTRRQGEMKAKLLKDIWIPPDLQVSFFLTAEHVGFAPGEFSRIQGSPETIEGADAEGCKRLQSRIMVDRT